jgi:UDP-N-acetylmuramate--alanine ligase
VPGIHNVRNALAALCVAHWLGLSLNAAAVAMAEYKGSGRRFEILGEAWGVIVVDDYAHHPTEIRATLAAARSRYPDRKIWAVWQPHTYSRTRTMFNEFAASFIDADFVVVTEVYAAREPVPADFSSRLVVAAMQHPAVIYLADFSQAVTFLLLNLRPKAVLLVFSAGDADQISAQVLAELKVRQSTSTSQNSSERE